MTYRFQTPKGTQSLLVALLVGAAAASAATACGGRIATDTPSPSPEAVPADAGSSTTPDANAASSTTPDADAASSATRDADVDGPDVYRRDPDCTGVPKSCCYGMQKYQVAAGVDTRCGPNRDEDCCEIDDIPGGTFNRMNDPALPATMPGFRLGRFLVTTARFAVWMQEGGDLAANAPAEGAGAHPTLGYPATGWNPAWDSKLSATPDDLKLKVHTDPASEGWGCTLDYYPEKSNFPVDCIGYYLMNAFCAWDGGYAITEAQWEYAARGGNEQREYAWGSRVPDSIDISDYCLDGGGTWGVNVWCNNPPTPMPVDVGTSKNGQGKWGTYDLMGNLMRLPLNAGS